MFVAGGYAATSIAAIAADAGVSPQTVYDQFKAKAALLRAAVQVAAAGGTDRAVVDKATLAALGDITGVDERWALVRTATSRVLQPSWRVRRGVGGAAAPRPTDPAPWGAIQADARPESA